MLTTKIYLPFSALFSNSAGKCGCDLTPVLRPMLLHHIDQGLVLFLGPGSLDHGWIEDFLPPMKTLDICSAVEKGGNSLPVLGL
jgi:hypothetical protein